MLGQAKPFFKLILESEDRQEVERAAADYQKKNPGVDVVIDSWRDHIHHVDHVPMWRARTRVAKERSAIQRFFDSFSR